MLSWLVRSFRHGRLKRRGLYGFFDGKRTRYVDPIATWRKLEHHPTVDLDAIIPCLNEGMEPETSQMLGVLAETFDVKRYDPATQEGLTDREVVNLLDGLVEHMETLKKNTGTPPTSPAPTVSASSGDGSEASSSWGSRSIVNGSSPSMPTAPSEVSATG